VKLFDYIYYCSYRFFLKTPLRSGVDAWPGVFLAISTFVHGLTLYFLFSLVTGLDGIEAILHDAGRLACIASMFLLSAVFCWYYVWKENAGRVIRSFDRRGNERKYARLGALMLIETVLLAPVVIFLLVMSQKLSGWPPHP
jgi:hypothetical protein